MLFLRFGLMDTDCEKLISLAKLIRFSLPQISTALVEKSTLDFIPNSINKQVISSNNLSKLSLLIIAEIFDIPLLSLYHGS